MAEIVALKIKWTYVCKSRPNYNTIQFGAGDSNVIVQSLKNILKAHRGLMHQLQNVHANEALDTTVCKWNDKILSKIGRGYLS